MPLLTDWLADWLTVILICSIVIISPGPNFVITLRNSLVHSKQAGVYTALGLAIGDLIHIGGWLIGIGVLISQSILLFNLLKGLGAIYLIYIGIKSLQAKPLTAVPEQSEQIGRQVSNQISNKNAFRNGLLTCLLNPKVTLFFLALFTQIIRSGTPLWMQVVYGLTVASIEFCWFASVAITVSRPLFKRQFARFSHWFERVMGVVLIGLGLRLAFSQRSD